MVLHGFDKQIRSERFIQEPNHIGAGNSAGYHIRAEARHLDDGDIGCDRILE